jgi:ketosteroid isomerase-like protein
LGSNGSGASEKNTNMDDAYSIRLAKTQLREAYNKGDVNRVLGVFGDGFSDMSAGLASFYGPEARAVLRHRLSKLFARYRAELAVTIISIRVQGSLAFDWGWHRLTLTPKKGGKPRTTRTRYLEIWQKDANGSWKIAIFFDNLDVPPQMPPREVLLKTGKRKPVGVRRRRVRQRTARMG